MNAEDWFAARGWTVFPFQRAVWDAAAAGRSGLLHATTGAGKTYAVWFAALQRAAAAAAGGRPARAVDHADARAGGRHPARPAGSRARLAGRGAHRRHQPGPARAPEQALPDALITTPESLTLLLSHPDAPSASSIW
jgi:ATP-dependent Lhr-like helicase